MKPPPGLATDPDCRECDGGGLVTCYACQGSCAAPKFDPVLDDWWRRCQPCNGMGTVFCDCARPAELAEEERRP
jgi:hypothetical protein